MKTVDLGKVRGNMIYSGGAVTGSSAAGVIFDATGIEMAYAGDIYINLDASGQYNGCIYECIKPGTPDVATWSYKGSIRGPKVTTVNNLKSTSTEDALAAYQGKRIMDMMIEAGVFSKSVIVDCDLTAYGVKMTIDNVDSTFKITVDGKEYTYNYTASGTVDETTVSVVLGENIGMQRSGGVVSKIASSNAYIYSYKLTDSSTVEIYSKNTELWTAINELAQSHEVTGTVIDGEETLAMGPIHKFINGIKRMFYPITHAKAVWFNKAENKTVYDVVEEIMNKNSAGVVSDEYDPEMIYDAGGYCIHENTLMKCAGSTTGAFDPAKWEACTVASELSEQNKKIFYETNDFNTENTNDTWVPVINQGVLQHRVIPSSLIKQGDTWSNFVQADSLNIGFDSSSQNFIIQINFPDRTISRISYNKNNILNDYFNGASWERIWEK